MFNPLQILDRYSHQQNTQTDTADNQSIPDNNQLSEVSGQQSERWPSQKLADEILERWHLKTILPMISKFIPGIEVADAFSDLNDAPKWHEQLEGINIIISKVLQEDIDGGYFVQEVSSSASGSDAPSDTSETSETGWISSSSESVSSGDDGQREVHIDASADGELPTGLLVYEPFSENFDSGYKTALQGGDGTEWAEDDGDWEI